MPAERNPRSSHWPALFTATLAILATCAPNRATAATLLVGAGEPYPLPSAAAAAAHDGDRVVIAAGSYPDCAVWKANDITIEGAGEDIAVINGRPCAGKGLFITQGNNITVRGLTLTGAHVTDFNGAGIRAEGGNLTIDHVRFVHNEDGLLAGALPAATITIRDSAFIGNGTCQGGGGCAHGVYVGAIRLLRIEGSRFAGTNAGHHVKSRARRTEIAGCTLEDGATGRSSLAVDLPNGGAIILRGNHIEKGPNAENHTAAITIGAEGVTQPTPEITLEHNVFRVDGAYQAYLLDNRSATPASLLDNRLQGNALALRGLGTVQ